MTEPYEGRWPMAVLDGGDEPWERLGAVLGVQLAQLPPGGLLELLVRTRTTALTAARWCRRQGHEVLEYRVLPAGRHIRIRKTALPSGGE